jgi:hypothetical protein
VARAVVFVPDASACLPGFKPKPGVGGAYLARLEMGAAKAEKRFDLAAGQEVEIEFVAPAR